MSEPVGEIAERVLDAAGEAFRSRAGDLLPTLVAALVAGLQDVADLTDPGAAPTSGDWSEAFDLNTTPAPAWLGAVTGTPVPGTLTAEQARAYVRDRPAWRRGTLGAMRAAIRATYPVGRFDILERHGSPWRMQIRLYAAQADEAARAAVHAAALTQKPVGIVLETVIASGATYAHMRAEHGPTYPDQAADFPTYAAATSHVPEEGTIP